MILCIKMLYILVLCPALLASSVLTLTIDSQLGTSVEDCFERVTIGEQLPPDAIYRNVTELTTKECEQLCKQDTQCQTYDYGVGAKGNATCDMSKLNETEIQEKKMLLRHPDYDVYVRRVQCEQSAPLPLNQQFDDPEDGSLHRPVLRPTAEDRRPQYDDLIPHETIRPDAIPYRKPYATNTNYKRPGYGEMDNRPDHFDDSIPVHDSPLSYGQHRPQEIPFRPQNMFNGPNRPVLNDEFNVPSSGPVNWKPPRPDDKPTEIYNRPPKPYPNDYVPETPQYQYIVRPNRRPSKPISECDQQSKPRPEEQPLSDPYSTGSSNRPVAPQDRPKPTRPYDRPTYAYANQYASNYGPSQDDSIHVEIHNPQRPYTQIEHDEEYIPQRPSRPYYYNQGSHSAYGQGTFDYSNINYQSHQSNTHSSSGSDGYQNMAMKPPPENDDPNYNDDRYLPNYKPSRPTDVSEYGQTNYNHAYSENHSTQNYGSYSSNYGSQYNNYRPNIYGQSYNSNQSGYSRPYGNSQNNVNVLHDQENQSGYGHISNYGGQTQNQINDYNYQHGIYGTHLGYGTHHLYGIKQGSYGQYYYDRPNDYNNRPTYDNRPNTYRPIYQDFDNTYIDRPNNQYEQTNGQNFSKPLNDEENSKPNNNNNRKNQTDTNNFKPNNSSNKLDVKPVYEQDKDRPLNVPSYLVTTNGNVVTSKPVAVSDYGERPGYRGPADETFKACFRRVLAGKRALRSNVRRVVDCERLEDCMRECGTERRFPCESFNYRLDPSYRGKGLCELMTKPIEAFDLREDFVADKQYDFYEIDRNSLEPYCPDNLKGPGLMHSGFLSSKSRPGYKDQWRDRNWNGGYEYNRYDDTYRDNNRRHDNQIVPYQIGVSRIDNNNGWRQNYGSYDDIYGRYGGTYGGYSSYYKDRNDYHKSIDYWHLTDIHRPYYGVKQYSGTQEYGPRHGVKHYIKTHDYEPYGKHYSTTHDFDYYSLGNKSSWRNYGYGYGSWKNGQWNSSGSYWTAYEQPPIYYETGPHYDLEARTDDDDQDCSSRRHAGMSLGTGAVRRALHAHNVVECEAACFSERNFKCVSYSFKYSSSSGSDNCFLSERPYKGLEMSADSASDVYAMPIHQDCHTVSTKPWVESECFWHVRSGTAVVGQAVKAALSVSGLGACEAECIRAHAFFCRGFSFRFDGPTIGDDVQNCLLTSTPPTSLETGRGLRPSSGHELYARGNYGRGCEPALYDDVGHKESHCYLEYDNSARLRSAAVSGRAHSRSRGECARACAEAPFKCLSFSYSENSQPDRENCLLSMIRLFDLKKGVDYEHSADDLLFSYDMFNGQCWKKYHGGKDHYVATFETPHPLSDPTLDVMYPGTGPDEEPPLEVYISSGPSSPSGPSRPDLTGPPPPIYKPYPPSPSVPNRKPLGPILKPVYIPVSGADDPSGLVGPSGPVIASSGPSGPTGPSGPIILDGPVRPNRPGYRPSYPPSPDVIDYGFKPSIPPKPTPNYKPYYNPNKIYPGYKPGYERPPYDPAPYGGSHAEPGYSPGGPSRPSKPGYSEDDSLVVSWRHYTVSGFPCRQGTSCAQNHIVGHWACEPEGGEIGAWDYCCAPTHRCGYSEGFQKPWCYVGPSADQWRPCSEKYYPYHQHQGPHPLQGDREAVHPRPDHVNDRTSYVPDATDRHQSYLPEEDHKYWDELYRDGPKAYYDKYGNPLPGYARVPTEDGPYIKFQRKTPNPSTGNWVPVIQDDDNEPPAGLGAPRYWPVAYLHKGPPPNVTYLRHNVTPTTETYLPTPVSIDNTNRNKVINRSVDSDINGKTLLRSGNEIESRTTEETLIRNKDSINYDRSNDQLNTNKPNSITTTIPNVTINFESTTQDDNILNTTKGSFYKAEKFKYSNEDIKGIDDKLDDFTKSIEVFDLEDAKNDKAANFKTLEAEEKQIEAIGRLLASKRGNKIVLQKRSQNELESKKIAVDKDFMDYNFGNKFPTSERRGVIQKVTKEEIEKEKNVKDRSLEVSETTYVRPPRVLSTTENIRKAIINGKVFYDATIRDNRELFSNSTRKPKSLRLEENKGLSIIPNNNAKKNIRTRSPNPVRRVRRVYKKRYNPEEVRKRLLEREKNKQNNTEIRR